MGARPHYPNISNDDPADGDTLTWDAASGQWKSAAPSGGGGASTPPGQAAHYIGTWDVAVAYAAGDCVRAWDADNGGWALFQAKTATTGDTPDVTQSTAVWTLITQDDAPIIMWGAEDPNATGGSNPHGGGIAAPPGSQYVRKDLNLSSLPFAVVLWFTVSQSQSDPWGNVPGLIAGPFYNGMWTARRISDNENSNANEPADARTIAFSADGNLPADARSFAWVEQFGSGPAYSGSISKQGAREAHVIPTANATEAFNDVLGPIELTEQADPAAPAAEKARLYIRDNGSDKTQLVVRFPSGAVQVIATEP